MTMHQHMNSFCRSSCDQAGALRSASRSSPPVISNVNAIYLAIRMPNIFDSHVPHVHAHCLWICFSTFQETLLPVQIWSIAV